MMLYGREVLKSHLRTVHEKPVAKSPCPICGVELKQTSLKSHIAALHGEAGLPCQTCGKVFKNESYLKIHNQTHQTEQKHHCQICKQFFKCGSEYKHHSFAKHGLLKPPNATVFVCPDCDYKSPVQSKINLHRKATHCVSSFKCMEPGCEKEFKTKQLAKCHFNRVHRAGDASNCPKCEEGLCVITCFVNS